jgi:hypothetical protein
VSETLTIAPEAAATAEQLALPGAKEMFEAVGLTELPVGVSSLSKRQREFCLHYLQTGSAYRAATQAGYSDPAAYATKVMKLPAVSGFLARAIGKVAGNADELIKRVWKRSVDLQAELERLREHGSSDWRKEREIIAAVNQTDALLGTLLGKLVIKIEGNVSHQHSVLTPEDRAAIIKMQDEVAQRQQERCSAAN